MAPSRQSSLASFFVRRALVAQESCFSPFGRPGAPTPSPCAAHFASLWSRRHRLQVTYNSRRVTSSGAVDSSPRGWKAWVPRPCSWPGSPAPSPSRYRHCRSPSLLRANPASPAMGRSPTVAVPPRSPPGTIRRPPLLRTTEVRIRHPAGRPAARIPPIGSLHTLNLALADVPQRPLAGARLSRSPRTIHSVCSAGHAPAASSTAHANPSTRPFFVSPCWLRIFRSVFRFNQRTTRTTHEITGPSIVLLAENQRQICLYGSFPVFNVPDVGRVYRPTAPQVAGQAHVVKAQHPDMDWHKSDLTQFQPGRDPRSGTSAGGRTPQEARPLHRLKPCPRTVFASIFHRPGT